MLRRLSYIALNPFFQALVVALLIIFVAPEINKYKAEQVDMTTSFDQTSYFFTDLDHDTFTERIQTFHNLSGNAGITVRDSSRTLGQWNFKGIYGPQSQRIMVGDFNGDRLDEIYIFTLEKDSIFLQALEYGQNPDHFIKNRLVAVIGKTLMNPDYLIQPGDVVDMTGDLLGDLVFAINTGHSKTPRNVYIYDIQNDTLMVSPKSGAFISWIDLENLDQDQFPEILVSTYAAGNYNEQPVEYSDTSSWLMVLNHDLTFRFPPIEFPGQQGGAKVYALKSGSGSKNLICSAAYGTPEVDTLLWSRLSPDGVFIKKKYLNFKDSNNHVGFISRLSELNDEYILGLIVNNGFFLVDSGLKSRRISNVKAPRILPTLMDIDLDHEMEVIMLSTTHKTHLIYRKDFSFPVAVDFPIQSTPPIFSVKLNGPNPPQLSVQGDQTWKLFDYGINPKWRFRFLIWFGIYLGVLAFIMMIRKLYSFQLKRRYETEKKIATLQLSSVKAQMEPHFIMNTINTIGSSIYRQKPDEAYQLLLNFSGMVRSLLLSSDKLTRSLKEELDFVKNYLELEKSRFADVFTYSVHMDELTDPESMIPKMIIQLHSENALKHGLLPKKSGGFLDIAVSREQDFLIITITDNGIGRNLASKNISQSTGKGMKILAQFFETYNRHNKNQLRQEILDLYDEDKNPAGTQVQIFVPVDFNAGIF